MSVEDCLWRGLYRGWGCPRNSLKWSNREPGLFSFFLLIKLFLVPPCKINNEDEVLDLSSGGGRLFVPSTRGLSGLFL